MPTPAETCWTVVRAAATGQAQASRTFAETYLGIVRAFLVQRWRSSPALPLVDDAVQEVFLDLFRSGGALARLDPARTPRFRAFLFGVVRKVALRYEERTAQSWMRRAHAPSTLATVPAPDDTMSRQFDVAWAKRIVTRAAERQRAWAQSAGEQALRRVEILHLRFAEGLPIRDIAVRLGEAPERVHREYAKAREEFKQALRAEISLHSSGSPADLDRECQELLAVLS
jgi:RNA polymerase sigma-70 factor (ECF subfamily)